MQRPAKEQDFARDDWGRTGKSKFSHLGRVASSFVCKSAQPTKADVGRGESWREWGLCSIRLPAHALTRTSANGTRKLISLYPILPIHCSIRKRPIGQHQMVAIITALIGVFLGANSAGPPSGVRHSVGSL